jgi:hypothetical protein
LARAWPILDPLGHERLVQLGAGRLSAQVCHPPQPDVLHFLMGMGNMLTPHASCAGKGVARVEGHDLAGGVLQFR